VWPLTQPKSIQLETLMRILMILFACAAVAWGQADQPLHLKKTIDLPDVQGRIDHLSIDVKAKDCSLPHSATTLWK